MKKYEELITASVLICMTLCGIALAAPRSQEEPDKSKAGEAKKSEEKTAKPQPVIAVHIKVSAQGVDTLPNQSSIQLKGLEDCETLDRRGTLDSDGLITFSELPVCKVMLKILITGFDTKTLPAVDLADHKNSTIRIQIKSAGPPILN
jgi:hypothetical protein